MIRQKALHKFVQYRLGEMLTFGRKRFNELLEIWRNDPGQDTFTEYVMKHLPPDLLGRFEKEYKDPSDIHSLLPRYLLKEWCTEQGYDFVTLCRIIDDPELPM